MKIEIRDKDGKLNKMLLEMGQVLNIPHKATLARIIISDKYYQMFPEELAEMKKEIASNS